jgi:hypothetical protein
MMNAPVSPRRRAASTYDADHRPFRRPEDDKREQGDERHREGEERLHDAAQDVVDEPAVEAHHQAEERAERHADERRDRRDHEHVPRADDDAREDVAPESVGPEHVGAVVRPEGGVAEDRIARVGVVRRDRRPADRADEPREEHRGSDQELGAAGQEPHRLTPRQAPARQVTRRDADRIGGADRGCRKTGAHDCSAVNRIRGFSHEMRMSASSVANM